MGHRSGHNFIIIDWSICDASIVAMVVISNHAIVSDIIWFILVVRVPKVSAVV